MSTLFQTDEYILENEFAAQGGVVKARQKYILENKIILYKINLQLMGRAKNPKNIF